MYFNSLFVCLFGIGTLKEEQEICTVPQIGTPENPDRDSVYTWIVTGKATVVLNQQVKLAKVTAAAFGYGSYYVPAAQLERVNPPVWVWVCTRPCGFGSAFRGVLLGTACQCKPYHLSLPQYTCMFGRSL